MNLPRPALSPPVFSAASDEPLFDGEFAFTSRDFEIIAGILYARAGISLPQGKSALVYSRLVKRLRLLGLERFEDYCTLLVEDDAVGAGEAQVMLRALTTNVTRFFREPHHFDDLHHQVVDLADAVRAGGRLRLWSAGCSTGQEPYSMALTILAAMPDAPQLDVRILASDIDTDVLQTARVGAYGDDQLDAVPTNLQSWLEPAQRRGDWRIGAAARSLVVFKELNLNAPMWPMRGAFHAIFCRNVAIYFDDAAQDRLWRRFAPLTAPEGRLYVGHSERVGDPAYESCGLTAYRRRPDAGEAS